MKTHRTCGECRNSKPYDEEDFPFLCKKTGIAVYEDDCCEDFVPKEIKTCGECRYGQIIDFVCTKKDIAVCIDNNSCSDFESRNSKMNLSNLLWMKI